MLGDLDCHDGSFTTTNDSQMRAASSISPCGVALDSFGAAWWVLCNPGNRVPHARLFLIGRPAPSYRMQLSKSSDFLPEAKSNNYGIDLHWLVNRTIFQTCIQPVLLFVADHELLSF